MVPENIKNFVAIKITSFGNLFRLDIDSKFFRNSEST